MDIVTCRASLPDPNWLVICVWPATSTLHFTSIRNPIITDCLLVMRMDLCPFSWPKSKSESTRFLFPLCCTLTVHFSRKESQFDLYTVSIVPHIVCYIVYDIVCACFESFRYRLRYRLYHYTISYTISCTILYVIWNQIQFWQLVVSTTIGPSWQRRTLGVRWLFFRSWKALHVPGQTTIGSVTGV